MATEQLLGHDLFQFLRPDQIQTISDVAERVSLKSGETVFSRGEEAQFLFIVLEGQVALRLPGRSGVSLLIDEAGKGAVFGSCVCMQMDAYMLTAQCVLDSKLLKIEAATLKGIMEDDMIVGYAVQSLTSRVYFKRYVDTMKKLQAVLSNIPLEAE